jgi:hypothetical protein
VKPVGQQTAAVSYREPTNKKLANIINPAEINSSEKTLSLKKLPQRNVSKNNITGRSD